MRTKEEVCSENPSNPVWFTEECLLRAIVCYNKKEWQKQMEKQAKEQG
jgi:hypothetical protein